MSGFDSKKTEYLLLHMIADSGHPIGAGFLADMLTSGGEDAASEATIGRYLRKLEMQGLLRFLLAAQNPDQGAREEMKDILDKIDLCQAKERVKLDKQFHDHLIKISGNHLLVLLNEALSELFETMISDYTLHITQKNWDRLLDCHRRVYDCLIKNAVQEGVKAIREHYNIIDEDLKEYQIGE